VRIIKQIQTFVEDPLAQTTYIYARNSGEENFIHQVAAEHRIGRESIRPTKEFSLSEIKGIRVKIWKVALYMSSTIPRAEMLSSGPIGVPPELEDKTPIEMIPPYNRYDEDIGSVGPVVVEVVYTLKSTGEVSKLD
jgi:hypothetical protein